MDILHLQGLKHPYRIDYVEDLDEKMFDPPSLTVEI
jgi:hypothetical protein